MRVLVTGGSGFIGTNMIQYYLDNKIDILNVDIAPPKNVRHNHLWKECDIRDFEKLKKEMESFSPTHVMHLAARTGEGKDISEFNTNTDGVENLITTCKGLKNLQRVVFTSSQLVCREDYKPKHDADYCPPNLYGKSKMIGEQIIRKRTKDLPCPWVIARPIGIWGPWFGVPYKDFFLIIARGFYVHPGRRGALQSEGYVGNTVFQFDKLATAPPEKVASKVFYLGDYPPTNLRDWANCIQNAYNARKISTVPLWPLKLVAKIGDFIKHFGVETPLLSTSRLNNMIIDFVYDIDPYLAVDLPYTLEDGVRITVEYLCSHQ